MLREHERPPADDDSGSVPQEDAEEGGIGARVDAVFVAAEKAAAHIISLAREEAEDLRRQTRVESEAERRALRSEADREAERILSDARAGAGRIEEDAREQARKIEDEGRARRLRLQEEARLMEERLDWAREGLREVTVRLGEVLPETRPADDEAPAA
jgi:cell division septum initiation protein DivIVA